LTFGNESLQTVLVNHPGMLSFRYPLVAGQGVRICSRRMRVVPESLLSGSVDNGRHDEFPGSHLALNSVFCLSRFRVCRFSKDTNLKPVQDIGYIYLLSRQSHSIIRRHVCPRECVHQLSSVPPFTMSDSQLYPAKHRKREDRLGRLTCSAQRLRVARRSG
jgi:hypothetical protein